MKRREPREKSNFRMDDSQLLECCTRWMSCAQCMDGFEKELYCIINAVLAQFKIDFFHGPAVNEELRQDCAHKFFAKTIPSMVNSASTAKKINTHAYLYQSAYYLVLQWLNKIRWRAKLAVNIDELNEMFAQLVMSDGKRVSVRDQSLAERVSEKIGEDS